MKVGIGADVLMKLFMHKAGDIHHAVYMKNARGRAICRRSHGLGRIRRQNSGRR
jgi:hypothetical protein